MTNVLLQEKMGFVANDFTLFEKEKKPPFG
jgi:hypothetical protein